MVQKGEARDVVKMVPEYFTTSFNPSGNHWIPFCGSSSNSGTLRYPRVFTDPSKSTTQWIVGTTSSNQFLLQTNNDQVERLYFPSAASPPESPMNTTLDGSFASDRPLVALWSTGGNNDPMDDDGVPLVPLQNLPNTSPYSSAVPLPNGRGLLWVDNGGTNSVLRYQQDNSSSEVVLETIDRPLWDGTITYSAANEQWAIFHGMTNQRYTHGALGDRYEGYKLSVLEWKTPADTGGSYLDVVWTVTLEGSSAVYEGMAPMWADVNNDGIDDLLTTVATTGEGAQLRAYLLEAATTNSTTPHAGARFQVANEVQSSWIGTGNRWLHQLGVGPFGPNGETEIVQVRMPHLLAEVRYHALSADASTLEEVYRHQGEQLSTHGYGDRNLDTVAIGDFNNDGIPELVLQDFFSTSVIGLQRRVGGAEKVWCVDIPGAITSNIAAVCPLQTSATSNDVDTVAQVLFSTRNELVRLQFGDIQGQTSGCCSKAHFAVSHQWWAIAFFSAIFWNFYRW